MRDIFVKNQKALIALFFVAALLLAAFFGGASGTLTASDGATYAVAMTYNSASRIPAGSSLEVSELSGERYRVYYDRALTETGGFDAIRLFDIRCVAPDGTEVEP